MNIEIYLQEKIEAEVASLVECEDQISELEARLDHHKKQLRKYQTAFNALTSQSEEQDSDGSTQVRENAVGEVQSQPQAVGAGIKSQEVHTSRPIPRETHPACPACGSDLLPGSRTLGNGRVVHMMICSDSGCNNEIVH